MPRRPPLPATRPMRRKTRTSWSGRSRRRRQIEMERMRDWPSHAFDEDKLHEECGVFGIFGHPEAGALAALGLHALQHRGQEAAGIVTFDGEHFLSERHIGLVGDN